ELQIICVTPDVSLSYGLVTLAGLIVLARLPHSPLLLAAAGAFCMLGIWLRGEGFILWLAGAVVVFRQQRSLAAWAGGGMLVALGHITYNLLAFNHAVPPPRGAIPWMVAYADLYAFQPLPDLQRWLHQGGSNMALSIYYYLRGCTWEVLTETPLLLLLAAVA